MILEDDEFRTGTGQILVNVHSPDSCKGTDCVIHRPSANLMRGFATHWRDDRGIMERICSHGVGHPDIDDLNFRIRAGQDPEYAGIHGCDGCCFGRGPNSENPL